MQDNISISTTKTEHRAINALECIIDNHLTMDYHFNSSDKEMSWDGYIYIYKKNNGNQSKKNFDSRVPVQIKGHNDDKKVYINKKRISYPIDLDDLKAYSSEKGVLYFQIFICEKQRSVFYSSLFPSKIDDYLEEAKENRKQHNITFTKLDKDAEKLCIIAKQFSEEAKRQGSIYNQLVQDRIRCNEFSNLTSVSLTVVGVKDEYDALKRLSAGDICLYGKMKDDKYLRPLQWTDKAKVYIGTEVRQRISVKAEVFYESYNCLEDIDGQLILKLSPNLEMRINEGIVNFKTMSTIKELGNDAGFLLRFSEESSFYVDDHEIKYTGIKYDEDTLSRFKYFMDLNSTLEMIGFDTNTILSKYSDKEKERFAFLVNLRKGNYNSKIKEDFCKYNFEFSDRIIPLLLIKREDEVELVNAVYTEKYIVVLPYKDNNIEKGYRMPLFVYQDVNVLSNLYLYDYEKLYKQIDNCDINEKTVSALLEAVLHCINVFDKNGDLHFLELAKYLLDKLSGFIEPELLLLNSLQINKRRGELKKDERVLLEALEDNDIHIAFGKYVLLGDKAKASSTFSLFTKEEQEQYYQFPIYKLFRELQ